MTVLLIVLGVFVLLFCAVALRGAPYVPTHASSLRVLFDELVPLTKDDLLVDIGSGDGIVLRAAARRGARALGYELNPVLVVISRLLAVKYGGRIKTQLSDFWGASFPAETTVVYTFGESRDIEKMYQKVVWEAARLNKRVRFVSYGFELKNVQPVAHKHAMNVYEVTPLQPAEAQV